MRVAKFVEATTYQPECEILLGMIQALYDVETRAKELTWQDRQALRQRESTLILAGLRQWLESRPLQDVLPKSDFAEAVRYLRNHWEALNVYVRDGRIPIDNNSVEQLMKQVAMGRKAWLFVCSVAGGEQSAKMMTLVSSARRHDLDVELYIKDVLDQLLAGVHGLPHASCPMSGSSSTPRPFASIVSKSGGTKPIASNSMPHAAASPPGGNGKLRDCQRPVIWCS